MGIRHSCRRAICPICKREVAILADPNGFFMAHGPLDNPCVMSGGREDEDFKKRLADRIKQDQNLLARL